jgi:hypothetical protein
MKKHEQVLTVKSICDAIAADILGSILTDKIPENWEVPQLRALVFDKASILYDNARLRGKEAGDYEKIKLEKKL